MKTAERLDRRSLRWKLPLLFGLTAILTVTTFGVFAYLSARKVALETATTRLQSALSQVRTIAELGVVNQLEYLRIVAGDPEIIAAVSRDGPVSEGAVRALQMLKGQSDSTVTVELLGRSGVVRYVLPEAAGTVGQHRTLESTAVPEVGPIHESDSLLQFEASIAIKGNASHAVGAIRVLRQQKNSLNQRMVGRMLDGAVLLTGNSDGTLWGPSGRVQREASESTTRYLRHGERWLSVASPIRGSPWLYAVEIPERLALAPANGLVLPFLITGLLIAFTGAFVGQRVSRRITIPLADLTNAAETLARGERDVRLTATDRTDEIGRLARAFSTMTASVTNARDRLEAEVETRTGELSVVSGQMRLLHEELREAERFASLGRMSGSVGHELRNPLGVMNNVAFLLETLPEASDTLRNYARMLREQIRVSDRIISDLLDRARAGAKVRTVVDIPCICDEVLLRAEVPDTIRVVRDVGTVPPLVLDRDHLGQILWNLVTNAVQAMQRGPGVLTVKATYAAGRLRIEVHDSGNGIAPSDLERIFEPMFTTKAAGVGLGLSVSRAFARANGGDLTVMSVERGACFVLELPADVAAEGANDAGSVPQARQASVKETTSRVRRDSPPRLEKV